MISTVSWMGGKNPFLGWAYVAAAALFALLGTAGLIRHLVKPRYLDISSHRQISSLMSNSLDVWVTCRYFRGTDKLLHLDTSVRTLYLSLSLCMLHSNQSNSHLALGTN